MKIFAAVLLLFTSLTLAQQSKSILELKNNFNVAKVENKIPFSSENTFHKKSAALAILYSVLLPGMGELYAGDYSSGKYFTIADGALWGTYFGLDAYSNWQKNNYKAYASSIGLVNSSGKNDTYYAAIGEYMNIEDYNNDKARNRDFEAMYSPQSSYWKWQTNNDRKTYRGMWTSSEQAHNGLRFVVGALILNRLVSAINAARLVAAYNKSHSTEMSWNVSVGLTNQASNPTGLQFNFTTQF